MDATDFAMQGRDDGAAAGAKRTGLFRLVVRGQPQETPELVARINALLAREGLDVTLVPAQLGAAAASGTPAPKPPAGETRLINWTFDGTLVEGAKVEAAWGVKRQTVDAARERGEVFSVWVKGKHWYPAATLTLERSSLAAINRALGDIDPSSKLLFLMRQHGVLGRLRPAEAIAQGQLAHVLSLAAEWARH
jgi:hypothetical protein